jgi:hypothetical protein
MATTSTYTYEYTANPYLEEAYKNELRAIEEAQNQYKIQADRQTQKAQQTQLEANRGATADYYNYINPYGITAEAMAYAGLKGSGLSQTNMARGYSDYQNRLGQAASAYANSEADILTQVLAAQAQANSNKLSAASQYQSNLANDYQFDKQYQFGVWQDNQDRLYQEHRDEIEDDRYKKEWAYTTGKNK